MLSLLFLRSLSTRDEMCLHYLFLYPHIDALSLCVSSMSLDFAGALASNGAFGDNVTFTPEDRSLRDIVARSTSLAGYNAGASSTPPPRLSSLLSSDLS